jgi:lysophospholipase L1-like esterase
MPKKTAVALAVALLVALLAAGAASGAEEYVALGDSYSSGTGTGEYYNEECRRSENSYAKLIGRQRANTKVVLRACSGAETADVTAHQLDALSAATRWVTITAGGNDAGFARVLEECAKPAWAADCGKRITAARRFIKRELPGRLRDLYEEVADRAREATVIVLSYPRLFKGVDCDAATFFSKREMERLNETADLLRDKTSRYARAAGPRFLFRDAIPAFAGHAVCSRSAWINGLEHPLRESFHPNRSGHRKGYAPLVRSVMR